MSSQAPPNVLLSTQRAPTWRSRQKCFKTARGWERQLSRQRCDGRGEVTALLELKKKNNKRENSARQSKKNSSRKRNTHRSSGTQELHRLMAQLKLFYTSEEIKTPQNRDERGRCPRSVHLQGTGLGHGFPSPLSARQKPRQGGKPLRTAVTKAVPACTKGFWKPRFEEAISHSHHVEQAEGPVETRWI